jgi:hypothetical protein
MAQHVLSLEAPDTMNKCILRVVDTSIYNPVSPPQCPRLLITLPGFTVPVSFDDTEISTGFILNLTACDLDLQTSGCGTTYNDLPDGIYIIKYSVSPNEYVYVEYNHLRVTKALNIIQCILCNLDLGACAPPTEIKDKLNELSLIEKYLQAAKANVEYCHQPEKGMELYRYALKLLDKLACTTGCGTCGSTC